MNNFQKIEKKIDNYFDENESKKEMENGKKKNFDRTVGLASEIPQYSIRSLLSIKNTDLTSYSPYLCIRSDGQLSFENISNKDDRNSFTFYLRIIPEINNNNSNNNKDDTMNANRIENIKIHENTNMNRNEKKDNKEMTDSDTDRNDKNYNDLNQNSKNSKNNDVLKEEDLRQFFTEGYVKISGAVDQNTISSCLR
jgi:hypothetical protein